MLLRVNRCTWLGYCALSWVRRSGGTDSKYQSSCPSAISVTDCSGVTPIVTLIPSRWPFGVSGVHDLKFGLRVITICCLGVYLEIMYGPVAILHCEIVETSCSGVAFGITKA